MGAELHVEFDHYLYQAIGTGYLKKWGYQMTYQNFDTEAYFSKNFFTKSGFFAEIFSISGLKSTINVGLFMYDCLFKLFCPESCCNMMSCIIMQT